MALASEPHVFISHAWKDGTDHAKRLYDALTKRGISAWLDLTNMNPFNDFSGEIDQQIKRASHVIVCVTPDIDREDSYVRLEIGYAVGHRKPIIAALFADVVPPSSIVNNTRAYFNRNWDAAFAQLLDYLGKPRDYEAPAADPFQDYLDALRQEIEDYLEIAIIREIPLHSQETPGAVQTTATKRMLGSLFATTLAVKPEEYKPPLAFDSLGDAFQHFGGRMLLLGEPGAGKTITLLTFVRAMLASRAADQTNPLPIFARIADWDGKTALPDWLAGQIPISRDDLAALIGGGKALLALDGLDELGGRREDPETKEKFDPRQQFLSLLPPNTPTIVSCRVTDYAEIEQKAVLKGAVTLQPLDDTQIEDYLSEQPDLWAALQADDGLRDMARTPLLLSLFAYAFNGLDEEAKKLHDLKRGDLRDGIFETYVRRRYEHEVRKRKLPCTLEEMTAVLQLAAYVHLMFGDKNILLAYDFERTDGGDPTSLIAQAQLLHLLVRVKEEGYFFVHLLLRDYFAFRMMIQELKEADNEHILAFFQSVIILGSLDEQRQASVLMELLLNKDTPRNVRLGAIVHLGMRDITQTIEPLIAMLNDEDKSIRSSVVSALQHFSDTRAVEALVSALNDLERDVRGIAARALERIGTPEALAAVEAWRKEHPDD